MTRRRAACAGAAAAVVWAAVEPLDRRLFAHDYSDVAALGRAVARGPLWPLAGLAVHAANGAAFGLVFGEIRGRTDMEPVRLGLALALAEHATLFPLAPLVDRFHPARGGPGLAPLATTRGFAQATFRHALFGLTLGLLAG